MGKVMLVGLGLLMGSALAHGAHVELLRAHITQVDQTWGYLNLTLKYPETEKVQLIAIAGPQLHFLLVRGGKQVKQFNVKQGVNHWSSTSPERIKVYGVFPKTPIPITLVLGGTLISTQVTLQTRDLP